ncbi:type II secretion system secretin GspD [Ruixingdingia sedimenti]|uniref:Type II secretion system secretin GspD n=1 Tax=Ruixingdingia sedimenti TaxID=3073604 RepID=A0ABU1F5Q0_9RHOB|nr:type II secretion system secretin GspD [Xinfangfangia sp. LG-4]MDR5651968.1 type II secretion system secretin GspD [Xinfangfangia sp. LG-4]
MTAVLLAALLLGGGFSAMAEAQVRLNLRDADLRAFVEIVAAETGRNYTLDSRVRGTVTVIAPTEVSADALYEIFLNVLELNRLTIVRGGQVDRIVPMDQARELSPALSGSGGYETRIFELQGTPVTEAAEVVRPLIAQEAVLTVIPASRLLIVSDRRESLDRVGRLLESLERARGGAVETVRLNHGVAEDMVETLRGLDIMPAGATLSADARANAILISGSDAFRARVRNLVTQLDTPQRSLQSEVVSLRYADASQLEPIITRSFTATATEGQAGAVGPQVSIVAEPQSNALVVTAPSDRIDAIVTAIRSLDQRPRQVLVEAVIFELSVENFSDLSAQFGALLNNALVGGAEFSIGNRPTLSSLVSAAMAGTTVATPGAGGTIGGARMSGDDGFVGFLSALARESSTRLLSTPSVMTLNNAEAEIVVAQNVPFVTGSFATVGDSAVPERPFQTVQREDVGLTLRVTPQITSDEIVRMEISQEVSSLTNTASAAGGEITSKRALKTNVLVRHGRVIMLGGLLENGAGVQSAGVPGLRKIPLIGGLFRGRAVNKQQRVLLMLLRPRIVNNDQLADQLTREVTADARRASATMQLRDDGVYPAVPAAGLPFDGVDLNQPFDMGIVDRVARERSFPPLPAPLRFGNGR